MASTNTIAPPRADTGFWMPSHCGRCLSAGCPRVETVTDAWAIHWPGGREPVTTSHVCQCCGHAWTDTWPVWGLLGIEEMVL